MREPLLLASPPLQSAPLLEPALIRRLGAAAVPRVAVAVRLQVVVTCRERQNLLQGSRLQHAHHFGAVLHAVLARLLQYLFERMPRRGRLGQELFDGGAACVLLRSTDVRPD